MPTRPASSAIDSASNTSRTRPLPLWTRSLPPSAVAMPAASWPRCCSTVSPSYSWAATSLWPTIPTMPHMCGVSLLRLRMRADDARDSQPGLHLRLQLVGFGAIRDRADAHAGQRALVGLDGFGEGAEAGGASAIAQRVRIGGIAERGELHRETDVRRGRRGRGP